MSDPDRWLRIEALYQAARGLNPGKRAAFLAAECAGDGDLHNEIESLLAQASSGNDFLNQPAFDIINGMREGPSGSMLSGRRIGPYDVQGLIGSGGMGEVYRARDTRLGRDVAIKILPRVFSNDPGRLARFEREARMLASLNHPHIGAIHGLEDADGIPALVLELIEGETLAERLQRGPIRISDALGFASQIADALDVAHEKGIIHRDLKPANIKVTPDGTVKVLDFGLAKAVAGDQAQEPAQAPTATVGGTREGVVLGAAAYMSPEQARGQAIDKRTDLWAFGCVLYEMLTARSAFARETLTDILAAVVESEPDWSALPAQTPEGVRRLLKHCLQKNPKLRLRDIGDARAELASPRESPTSDVQNPLRTSHRMGLLAAGCAIFAILGAIGWMRARSAGQPAEWGKDALALSVDTPPDTTFADGSPSISPDGTRLVWAASERGTRQLWVRPIRDRSAQKVPGTEGALGPFWSSDGQSVAFFTQGKLQTVDLRTNTVKVLLETTPETSTDGGSWSGDVILLSTRYAIVRTTPSGTAPVEVARLDRGRQENSLRYPTFLPDGRHFLYVARSGRPQQSAAYVGSLDTAATRLFSTTTAVYYANGHLVYGRDGSLVARTFDPRTFAVGPEVKPIAGNLAANVSGMDPGFAVSANGVVAYYEGRGEPESELWWVDRTGKALSDAPAVESGPIASFRLSRDGAAIVFDRLNPTMGGRNVWVLEPGGRSPSRLTFDGTDDWVPVFSSDGQRVAFMSYRNGLGDIYAKPRSAAGVDEAIIASDVQKIPVDWSTEARVLVYNTFTNESGYDIFAVPVGSPASPIGIATSKALERGGRISPDGRFILYSSAETGTEELYVQPFPPQAPNGRLRPAVGRLVHGAALAARYFFSGVQR